MSYADDRCLRPKQSLKGLEFLRENPIDVFVRLSVAEGYENERVDLNELHIALNGLWCDHNV